MPDIATPSEAVRLPSEISIRPFQPGDEEAFRSLNEQWITKYFSIEAQDLLVLGNPEHHILRPGGRILMAISGAKPIGCCALIYVRPGVFEVAKMAVAEDYQGKGAGRKLLQHIIAEARAMGATLLDLGSNSKLTNAIHLYESVGFRHVPPERIVPMPYTRVDVFMELVL